jgi:hypothetical protein
MTLVETQLILVDYTFAVLTLDEIDINAPSVHPCHCGFTEKEVNWRNTACVVVSHPSAPGGVFYATAGSTRLLKVPKTPEGDTSDEEDAAAAVAGDLEMLPSDDERRFREESPPSDAGDAEPEPAPSSSWSAWPSLRPEGRPCWLRCSWL